MKWCVWGGYSHKSHLKRLPSLKKVFTWDWRHTTFILAQIFSQPPFVLSLLLKIYWRVGSSFNPNLLFFFFFPFFFAKNVLYLKQEDERLASPKRCFPTL